MDSYGLPWAGAKARVGATRSASQLQVLGGGLAGVELSACCPSPGSVGLLVTAPGVSLCQAGGSVRGLPWVGVKGATGSQWVSARGLGALGRRLVQRIPGSPLWELFCR